jgi:hypothetical protein
MYQTMASGRNPQPTPPLLLNDWNRVGCLQDKKRCQQGVQAPAIADLRLQQQMLVKRRVRQSCDEYGDEDELDAIEEGTESDPRPKPTDSSQSIAKTERRQDGGGGQ